MQAINITWETDYHIVDLPKTMPLPPYVATCRCSSYLTCEDNKQSARAYLSDQNAWLVGSFKLTN